MTTSFWKLLKADLERYRQAKQRGLCRTLVYCLLNPDFYPLLLHRLAHAFYSNTPRVAVLLARLAKILTTTDIGPGAEIGGGCLIIHGIGLVIGNGAVIGSNSTLYHQVTIGTKWGILDPADKTYPVIGKNVTLFPGAKILGSVRIGDNAIVGANAVVIEDVPPDVIIAGNPARVITRSDSSLVVN